MINSISEYLINTAISYPDKVAIINNDNSISYRDLNCYARKLAKYFSQCGISKGDRIVIALDNSIASVICFYAGLFADGVVSLIDNKQPLEKITYIIKDSGAKIFISDKLDNELDVISSHADNVLLLGDKQLKDIYSVNESMVNDDGIEFNHLDIDLASIIYTSGSTGEPKGVMLTHRNMLAASNSIISYLNNGYSDTVISALPLSFDYGLYQIIMMVAVGGTLILEKDFLLPSRFLKLIETYHPTALPVVPSMVPLLKSFSALHAYDVSSIRYITNTGAALATNHIEQLKTLFPQSQIFSMYGLTECKRCTYLPPIDLIRKSGSIGIPIPNTEMWIADDNGNKCSPGVVGEIVVRGQTVMKGYWNKPEETNKKLKPGLFLGEHVLFTGDLGYVDDDGYFYFHGRKDEVIKSRGMKVSPKEVEMKILQFAGVCEVAAVGIEHAGYGQALSLFVVTSNTNITKKQIEDFCKSNLRPHEIPVEIMMKSSLPKTTNGKIDKKSLLLGLAKNAN